MWMAAYVPAHEGFLPVKDADATREMFRRWFAERLDREPSFVARDGDGHVVAATMMTAEIDGVLVPNLVEVSPGHPASETAAIVRTELTRVPRAEPPYAIRSILWPPRGVSGPAGLAAGVPAEVICRIRTKAGTGATNSMAGGGTGPRGGARGTQVKVDTYHSEHNRAQ